MAAINTASHYKWNRKTATSKYKNDPCYYNGFRFDSKKEANYCKELDLRVKAGEVAFYLRQVPFHLTGGVIYRVDFMEFHADGGVHCVDVKGFATPEFKNKKKQAEALFPITIEVI
jgi:hypothetical protein